MDQTQKQQLVQYVSQQLRQGVSAPAIRQNLRNNNWPEQDITTAFETFENKDPASRPLTTQSAPVPLPQNVKLFLILSILAVPLLFAASLTKGWFSLLLVPLLLPVYIVLTIANIFLIRRARRQNLSVWVLRYSWIMLISTVVLYIFIPGFGDTNEALILGFISIDTMLIPAICGIISALAALVSFVSTIALVVSLIVTRTKKVA